jgi:polyisoprenyl-phosphate glycosyltransferase
MKGLFSWVGFRTEFVDYDRAPRAVGSTKFAGWALWNFAIEGFTSFSTAPLRIWTYVGFAGAMLTAMYASAVFFRTLLWGIDVPGYASLLVVILFFGSLQLISLGLLGEYIGRIYVESKQRPIYIVRKEYGRRHLTDVMESPARARAGTRAVRWAPSPQRARPAHVRRAE